MHVATGLCWFTREFFLIHNEFFVMFFLLHYFLNWVKLEVVMNIPESLIRVAEQSVKLRTLPIGTLFKIDPATISELVAIGWPEDDRESFLKVLFIRSRTVPLGRSSVAGFNLATSELSGFGDGDFDVLSVEIIVPSAS
jgi:hypothetical protein